MYEMVEDVKEYSGYRGNERPVSFVYKNTFFEVEEIISNWREPGGRLFFEVKTTNGEKFLLCYFEDLDRWFVKY